MHKQWVNPHLIEVEFPEDGDTFEGLPITGEGTGGMILEYDGQARVCFDNLYIARDVLGYLLNRVNMRLEVVGDGRDL